jgi:hypothetical protein
MSDPRPCPCCWCGRVIPLPTPRKGERLLRAVVRLNGEPVHAKCKRIATDDDPRLDKILGPRDRG